MDTHTSPAEPAIDQLVIDDERSRSTKRLFTLIGLASAAFWATLGVLLFA